ncbi:MAG: hypothetical protein GY756_27155 [bacterium]|nr:hypothetical protein [bacterium]
MINCPACKRSKSISIYEKGSVKDRYKYNAENEKWKLFFHHRSLKPTGEITAECNICENKWALQENEKGYFQELKRKKTTLPFFSEVNVLIPEN